MTYTEIKEKNGIKYYYRVRSIRNGKKFKKQRIYLGKNLSKERLLSKEIESDNKLNVFHKKKNLILNKLLLKIRNVLRKNNIKKAGIFGSYARGEQKKNSDIDILIKPPKGLGFKYAGVELELEDKLKKKVDLLTYNGIHPLLRERILKEEIKIL